jgi:AAA+ superfamily predicted ATPase
MRTYPVGKSDSLRHAAKYPTGNPIDSTDFNGLLPFLEWLDQRLAQALATIQAEEAETGVTSYPGLMQPSPERLERSMVRELGKSPFEGQGAISIESIAMRQDSILAWLQRTFELSAVDLEIVTIALAPEVDRRYEKLYAYLQDDVRCKRPTVDLALNLLGHSAPEKLIYRTRFATDAPLVQQGLLHLIADPHPARSALLPQELHLDEQVVNLLLNQPGLDRQLKPFCCLSQPMDRTIQPQEQALLQLVTHHWQADSPLRLYFQGIDQAAKRHRAEAIAATLNVPLLVVDLARLVEEKAEFASLLQRVLREAQFQGALLYLDDLDRLQHPDHQDKARSLGQAIAHGQGIVILAGQRPYVPIANTKLGVLTISFVLPDTDQRRALWQAALNRCEVTIDDGSLQALSDRFQLTADQIEDAVATACNTARLTASATMGNGNSGSTPILLDLFAAARSQAGHDLTALARKIEPKHGWEDIVLPPNQTRLLQELCQEAQYQMQVWELWGFAKKLSLGRGLNVLFSGPPGTGKTFAAEVIAHELQLDLYQIDLSQMVSKYIGETEKNLNRVFTAAANSNAILLFDEADALFGKRSEVRDAHDRYANIETSYLLQKMEEYEGVAILTTNFRSNMDDAFVRRLRYIVEFALPGAQERQRIWERIWPPQTPRDPALDLEFMAYQFELPGANIRNIALRAAFLAAGDGGTVMMKHLITALQREYQKMGKMLMVEQLGAYARFL